MCLSEPSIRKIKGVGILLISFCLPLFMRGTMGHWLLCIWGLRLFPGVTSIVMPEVHGEKPARRVLRWPLHGAGLSLPRTRCHRVAGLKGLRWFEVVSPQGCPYRDWKSPLFHSGFPREDWGRHQPTVPSNFTEHVPSSPNHPVEVSCTKPSEMDSPWSTQGPNFINTGSLEAICWQGLLRYSLPGRIWHIFKYGKMLDLGGGYMGVLYTILVTVLNIS